MPRTARASQGGYCYHVINRGNGQTKVFHKKADYAAFVQLMIDANERLAMRLTGYCLMPNHFHLVLWPHKDGDLSRWMQWLLTSHVRRYHRHYKGCGHVWQGRFKAFPIQKDEHYLSVLRYVERNPLRAKLVEHAQDWSWSSLSNLHEAHPDGLLADGPLPKGSGWTNHVNAAQSDAELGLLRASVNRGTPFGSEAWARRTAAALGLEASLRPRGRPRKK
jgi:putative transposase